MVFAKTILLAAKEFSSGRPYKIKKLSIAPAGAIYLDLVLTNANFNTAEVEQKGPHYLIKTTA